MSAPENCAQGRVVAHPVAPATAPPVARVLSEAEIQDRLYGGYLGRRRPLRRAAPAPAPVKRLSVHAGVRSPEPAPAWRLAPVDAPPRAPAWTGQEILSGELHRLRSELINLRQEKERLQIQLQKIQREPSPPALRRVVAPPLAPAAAHAEPSSGGWLGGLLSMLVLLGALGVVAGVRVLQALPAAGELTPYTVQVAVYDVRSMADRAQELLQELGYSAFQVQMPRANGRARYRIYVGSFVTQEEARQEYVRLTSDPRFQDFKDAFVRLR